MFVLSSREQAVTRTHLIPERSPCHNSVGLRRHGPMIDPHGNTELDRIVLTYESCARSPVALARAPTH